MYKRAAVLPQLLAAALLAAGCSDAVGPERPGPGVPRFATAGTTGIVLDQQNSTLGPIGTTIAKGFNPTNPHLGDAIIATFLWQGSTNIITGVTDHLTNGTPVGNTYTLAEYVTAGGLSMATYVATNLQNFPDPNPDPTTVLVVQANLSTSGTDGGVLLSAWSGAQAVFAQAVGAHHSAVGSGSSTTTADPGAITVNAGALAYGVTMSNGVVGLAGPAGFTPIATISDASLKADGEYAVQPSGGSVDPRWTWFFNSQSTWLATVLALNPAGPPPANDFVTGGGKLQDGRQFATFGFVARPTGGEVEWVQHCPDGVNPASPTCNAGQFTFHGTLTAGTYAGLAGYPTCRTWSGTGSAKEIGTHNFTVNMACDNGASGPGVDYIDINIDGYHNYGHLTGGNNQLHKSQS